MATEKAPENVTDEQPATETAPEEPKLTPEEEAAAAEKRSEAAKKGAATRAANQAQAELVEDVYKHLRHTVGAEVSIDQARVIVEMVQAPAAAAE